MCSEVLIQAGYYFAKPPLQNTAFRLKTDDPSRRSFEPSNCASGRFASATVLTSLQSLLMKLTALAMWYRPMATYSCLHMSIVVWQGYAICKACCRIAYRAGSVMSNVCSTSSNGVTGSVTR